MWHLYICDSISLEHVLSDAKPLWRRSWACTARFWYPDGMTAVEFLTPFGPVSDVVELSKSGVYRKQILRFQTINYRDKTGAERKITFDRNYAQDLIRAYQDGAYDQVPFQLADAANNHNNDPTRTGGELVGVELSADGSGLDGLVRLWGGGREAVRNNRKLGVSARIVENLTHSDGRTYPRALQHVLGTLDPQVTKMHPWQRVELSNGGAGELVDLSDHKYGRDRMPETKPDDKTEVLELTSAQATRLRTLLEDDEALEDLASQLPEGFFDNLGPEDDEEDEEDETGLEAQTDLSGGEDGDALELTRAQLNSQESRIVELTNRLNAERVKTEVEHWQTEGLAPAVIEAARPLLQIETGALELSNGTGVSVDPGETVRELLSTVVDLARSGHLLTNFDEIGSLIGETTDSKQKERDALVAQFDN